MPAQGKCQVPGCSRDAVVLCSDCKPGGVLFCPRHDSEQHPFAHEHRRAALTSGFKHPLRPTQQYEDGQAQGQQRQQLRVHEQQQAGRHHASWPDVLKVFDLPPGRACGCANDSSAKHWVLQERSVQEQRKPLIVVGQSGKSRVTGLTVSSSIAVHVLLARTMVGRGCALYHWVATAASRCMIQLIL